MKKDIIIIMLILILIILGIHEINTLSKKDITPEVANVTSPNNEKNYITDDDKVINVANNTANESNNAISTNSVVTKDAGNYYGNSVVSYTPNPNYITYNENDLKKEDAYFDENGVNIEVIENSITKTGCQIRITNSGGDPGDWNQRFWLERKENGEWNKIDYIDDAFWKEGHEGTLLYYYTQTLNWTYTYGELEPGIYRIKMTQETVSVYLDDAKYYYSNEFEIK
jgi:hypothetical protein